MKTTEKVSVTVRANIISPVEKVWNLWSEPKHITQWNNASEDWHTPKAENDLRTGGKFMSRMEAKDGSSGFDFTGKYVRVDKYKYIEYNMEDGRNVKISFTSKGTETIVTETFDAEQTNPVEMQKSGWQAILDNFKKYVENYREEEPVHYEIIINADVEKVYKTMLAEKTYTEWTSEFNPTSYFQGSWEKGSKILFLGTDKDGIIGGMVSRINENFPNRFVSIEHQGIVQNGDEIKSGTEAEMWAGSLENYTFLNENGKTRLIIDLMSKQKISDEFLAFFKEAWPKALKKLKTICEEK